MINYWDFSVHEIQIPETPPADLDFQKSHRGSFPFCFIFFFFPKSKDKDISRVREIMGAIVSRIPYKNYIRVRLELG